MFYGWNGNFTSNNSILKKKMHEFLIEFIGIRQSLMVLISSSHQLMVVTLLCSIQINKCLLIRDKNVLTRKQYDF